MTEREALKLALEALENLFGIPDKWTGEGGGDVAVWRLGGSYRAQQAITAIKEALANDTSQERVDETAKQRHEPVAYSYTSRITGAQGFSHHPMPRFVDSEFWDIKPLYAQQYIHIASTKQELIGWKLVPIEPTNEMLKAMDECSTEGYDERLLAGHASSVYMAAVDVAPTPPPVAEPHKRSFDYKEHAEGLQRDYDLLLAEYNLLKQDLITVVDIEKIVKFKERNS